MRVKYRPATFEAVPLDGTGREPNRKESVAIGAAAVPYLLPCSSVCAESSCDSSAEKKSALRKMEWSAAVVRHMRLSASRNSEEKTTF
ncbi:hypothetical protein CN238_21820 [Sinorhizobium meliloti]|nr:hypothetical protein CN238_21820 [Sinorhizobium meliloti]RVH25533.1 hypothetical protein CN214_23595 [Sinorhizobium meliloti]